MSAAGVCWPLLKLFQKPIVAEKSQAERPLQVLFIFAFLLFLFPCSFLTVLIHNLCEMDEFFEITIAYKEQELAFPARLIQLGYTHNN
jgi:hypothetical protein